MGVLWGATDERSGQSVAIRVLERGVDDELRVAHFRASALAAARMRHRNIARVLDEGLSPLGPFIVTEWIDGVALAEWRGARLPWGFLREVCAQICEALSHIHAHGLMHLDLRPRNIMVLRDGERPWVRITDVGCGRIEDGWKDRGGGARATLKYLGSLRYMAPEVAEAPPWMIGPHSDLYSFGLVLWEMLCGTIPDGDVEGMALLMRRAQSAPPVLPGGVLSRHERQVRTLLGRLLAKRPADRPSAAQVRRTIELLEDDETWCEPQRPTEWTQPSFDHAAAPTSALPLVPLALPPVLGREDAQRAVWQPVQAVVGGSGSRVVLIEGRPATGKSLLLSTIVEQVSRMGAARIWRVRFDRHSPPGTGLMGALDDLLRSGNSDAAGIEARIDELPLLLGADGAGLREALPGLMRPDATPFARPGNEPSPGVEVGGEGTAVMLRSLFVELLRRTARSEAVLLCLEDLHLAPDSEGAELVEAVVRRFDDLPVCIVATARADDRATQKLKTRFPEGGVCHWVGLPPHDELNKRAYIKARLGLCREDEDRVLAALRAVPGHMRELCDHLLDGRLQPGPAGQRIVLNTLLPESASELFEALLSAVPASGGSALVPDTICGLALARLPLTPRVLNALVADDPHRPYHRALACAERARLMVRSATGSWRFCSESLRDWLQQRLGLRAESWNLRWLRALDRLEGQGRGQLGLERGHHGEAVGDLGLAVNALLEAAQWALGPGQQALSRGLTAARRASELAATLDRPRLRARAARARAELMRQAGHPSKARVALTEAFGLLQDPAAAVERGWCTLVSAWLAVDERDLPLAARLFNAARESFEKSSYEGGVLWTFIGHAHVASLQGQHRTARTLARQAEKGFEEMGAQRGVLAARMLRASTADASGDHAKAEQRYGRLQALADERRWLLESTRLRLDRVRTLTALQRPHDALVPLDEAADLATALGLDRATAWIVAVRPALLAAAGQHRQASVALQNARIPPPHACTGASATLRAALEHPTARLDEKLHRALSRWADQVANEGDVTI